MSMHQGDRSSPSDRGSKLVAYGQDKRIDFMSYRYM